MIGQKSNASLRKDKGISYVCQVRMCGSVLWAQGYSIENNRIVVEGEEQWKEWSYPKGTLDIAEDEGVRPVYIRKNINACLNAQDFTYADGIRGGISDAGSNAEDAENIIDGDPTTYWEPDREDPLRDFIFRDIQFLDAEEGWISGSGTILHTQDGGRSWDLAEFREDLYVNRLWGWAAPDKPFGRTPKILHTTGGRM